MRLKLMILMSIFLLTETVQAGPISLPIDISRLRPYTTGTFFVYVNAPTLLADGSGGTPMGGSGNPNCTNVFKVNPNDNGKDEVVAALYLAYAQDKKIRIEVPTTSCQAWATSIQSIYLE